MLLQFDPPLVDSIFFPLECMAVGGLLNSQIVPCTGICIIRPGLHIGEQVPPCFWPAARMRRLSISMSGPKLWMASLGMCQARGVEKSSSLLGGAWTTGDLGGWGCSRRCRGGCCSGQPTPAIDEGWRQAPHGTSC